MRSAIHYPAVRRHNPVDKSLIHTVNRFDDPLGGGNWISGERYPGTLTGDYLSGRKAIAVPANPLDVLAQQIVAMCCQAPLTVDEIERIGRAIEQVVMAVPGTTSAYSERVAGGRYIDIVPDRAAAARYGLNIEDLNQVIAAAVGGINLTQTVEGLERYPVNLRFPRERRDDIQQLRQLPMVTPTGAQIPLAEVAEVRIVDGAPMLKSENGRLNGWTFVDIRGVDLGSYVAAAQQAVREQVELPAGYSITWSGQYEYMLRAQARLNQVVPLTLVIIFVLLYLTFRHAGQAFMVMASLPFALVGGFWFVFLLDFNLSVAVGVGFIALAGVAAEFGVVMLVYLDNALRDHEARGPLTQAGLREAIMEGAVMRVRPKAMTVATIIAGLLPIFLGTGTGSEVMSRIAAPMIGGMITAPLLSLFVIPVIYLLWKGRGLAEPAKPPRDEADGLPAEQAPNA